MLFPETLKNRGTGYLIDNRSLTNNVYIHIDSINVRFIQDKTKINIGEVSNYEIRERKKQPRTVKATYINFKQDSKQNYSKGMFKYQEKIN